MRVQAVAAALIVGVIASCTAPDADLDSDPEPEVLHTQSGEATFYGDQFDGRVTASGDTMDQSAMVAAHRTYPFGTAVRVTNPDNDSVVEVEVIDRGPFSTEETIIDLSREAAEQLDFIEDGRTPVEVEVLEWGGEGAEAAGEPG